MKTVELINQCCCQLWLVVNCNYLSVAFNSITITMNFMPIDSSSRGHLKLISSPVPIYAQRWNSLTSLLPFSVRLWHSTSPFHTIRNSYRIYSDIISVVLQKCRAVSFIFRLSWSTLQVSKERNSKWGIVEENFWTYLCSNMREKLIFFKFVSIYLKLNVPSNHSGMWNVRILYYLKWWHEA